MKKNLKKTLFILLCLLLSLSAFSSVQAAKNGWVTTPTGKIRYFNNGTYVTGQVKIDGKTYYFKPNGVLYVNSFVKEDADRYHTNKNGVIYTNILKKFNDKYYYFGNDGKAVTGWQTINNYRYFFRKNFTAAAGGSFKIGGKYYIFYPSARLANNGTSARLVNINGVRYYVSPSGNPVTGWNDIGEKVIYVYEDGHLATNTTIDGIDLDEKGYGQKATNAYKEYATQLANEFIAAHGGSGDNTSKLRNCFNYILAYENFDAGHAPTGFPSDPNWVYMEAISMFSTNLKGNCLGFSASVAACASALGFEPTIIYYEQDHSVVVINGLFYDNMGGGIFAGSAPYSVNSAVYGAYVY